MVFSSFLDLKDDSLRNIFYEGKCLLKGLHLCKEVRTVLLEGHSFAENNMNRDGCSRRMSHLVVKDIKNLKGCLRR